MIDFAQALEVAVGQGFGRCPNGIENGVLTLYPPEGAEHRTKCPHCGSAIVYPNLGP